MLKRKEKSVKRTLMIEDEEDEIQTTYRHGIHIQACTAYTNTYSYGKEKKSAQEIKE